MALELTCPHCSRRLAIRNPQPGSTIHCPVCTCLVPIPADAKPSSSTGEPSSACWWVDHPDNPAPPAEEDKPPVAVQELINRKVVAGAVLAAGFLVAGMVAT